MILSDFGLRTRSPTTAHWRRQRAQARGSEAPSARLVLRHRCGALPPRTSKRTSTSTAGNAVGDLKKRFLLIVSAHLTDSPGFFFTQVALPAGPTCPIQRRRVDSHWHLAAATRITGGWRDLFNYVLKTIISMASMLNSCGLRYLKITFSHTRIAFLCVYLQITNWV